MYEMGPRASKEQFDPAWRLYRLIKVLEQNPSWMLSEAIDERCQKHRWLTPEEVIVDALGNAPTISDMLAIWGASNHPGLRNVIRSFHHYFFAAMRIRLL
jgi:hypothetical protein